MRFVEVRLASSAFRSRSNSAGLLNPNWSVCDAEVDVEEVGRVTEVTRPAEQVQLRLAALHRAQVVRPPRRAVRT